MLRQFEGRSFAQAAADAKRRRRGQQRDFEFSLSILDPGLRVRFRIHLVHGHPRGPRSDQSGGMGRASLRVLTFWGAGRRRRLGLAPARSATSGAKPRCEPSINKSPVTWREARDARIQSRRRCRPASGGQAAPGRSISRYGRRSSGTLPNRACREPGRRLTPILARERGQRQGHGQRAWSGVKD